MNKTVHSVHVAIVHHIPGHEVKTFDEEWKDWDAEILSNGSLAEQRTDTGILLKLDTGILPYMFVCL